MEGGGSGRMQKRGEVVQLRFKVAVSDMQHKHFISLLFVLFNYAVINFVTHTHIVEHTHAYTRTLRETRKDKDNCELQVKKAEVERARRGYTQDKQKEEKVRGAWGRQRNIEEERDRYKGE